MLAQTGTKTKNVTNILLIVVMVMVAGLFAYSIFKNRKIVSADGTVSVEGDDIVNPPTTDKAIDKAVQEVSNQVA